MFGNRRKRTRGKIPCAPGAVKEDLARQGRLRGDQNRDLNCRRLSRLLCRPQTSQEFPGKSRGDQSRWPNHQGAVPSGNRDPASPARTTGKGPRSKLGPFTTPPRPSSTGRSTLHPTARVEPPATAEVPVEQVAQKRKATSPLPQQLSTRPTSPSSPTRWEMARRRIKGRFKDYITPPIDNIADLPRKPASSRWQILHKRCSWFQLLETHRNGCFITCLYFKPSIFVSSDTVYLTGWW